MTAKLTIGSRVKRRAIAALAAGALGVTSLIAAAVPAAAAEFTPGGDIGTGTLTVSPETARPGDTLTVSGVGFDLRTNGKAWMGVKLRDGGVDFTSPQSAGDVTGGTIYVRDSKFLPVESQDFSFQVTLPADITDGLANIRLLGGQDGNAAVSKSATFTVNKDYVPETTPVVTGGEAQTSADGSATLAITGSNLPADAKVTAAVDQTALKFRNGRQQVDSITVASDGTINGTVNIPAGVAPAGKYVVKVVVGDATYNVDLTTTGALAATDGTAVSSTTGFTVANLPAGTEVTEIKAGDDVVLWSGKAAADDKGVATIKNVTIPTGTTPALKITAAASKDGKPVAVTSSLVVTPDNTPFGTDKYTVTESGVGVIPQGLYQSKLNPNTNDLFVTTSVGRPPVTQTALLKVDGTTLALKGSVTPALVDENKPDGARMAVYGIDLDNDKGLVWVTNTRNNTVSVYKQDDLSLVYTWPADSTSHPRDVVVDPTTHKAYVSGSGNQLTVFDLDNRDKVEKVQVFTDEQKAGTVMSLTLDNKTGKIYTVALNAPLAASVDVRNGNKVAYFNLGDNVSRASGVAYDSKRGHIASANQGTDNLVVVDEKTNKVIADIPTGAQALNAVYDPSQDAFLVVNRTGGTLTVIDADTLKPIANLAAGKNTNHVSLGVDGVAYVVDKGNPNKIFRYAPVKSQPDSSGGKADESNKGQSQEGQEGDKQGNKQNQGSAKQSGLAKTGTDLALPLALAALLAGSGVVITMRRRSGLKG